MRFEYRYITRGDLNGFPKGAITDVKVDPDKLNAIIAEYTVYHAEPSMELYSKVFAMAVRYLKRNDYQSASALFEVYLQENPGDAKAINARGFCMLPEKPYDAERIILKALRNGFRDKAVGYYNLCCCQYLQKEPAKVLKTANLFWSEQSDAEKTYSGALLWKVTEGMCELKDSEAYKEMALLCIRCAELTDNKDASKLWNSRLRMPFLPRQESPDDRPSHS